VGYKPEHTKQQSLIKKTQKKCIRQGYKFGIHISKTVEEALSLDADNCNHLWEDAITKGMLIFQVALNLKEKGAKAQVGYRLIPCHMIFDIKMDFTWKARLVAGGHLTVSTIRYSSVVS
jgi:hypothetical protein